MLQKNLTYGQATLALYEYLTSSLYEFAGSDSFKIDDKLILTKFTTLLKKMPEIKPNHRKFTLEYSNKPIETGHIKLFPSMGIEVRSGSELFKKYELVVEEREGERRFYIESDGYTIESWPIKEMLSIQKGEEIPSGSIELI